MRFLLLFHPSNFFRALHEIDDEAAAERASLKGPDYRPAVILFVATFCLLINASLSHSWMFRRFLKVLSQLTGYGSIELNFNTVITTFSPAMIYVWWAFVLFVGYVLIPVLVIKYVLRDSVRN